MTGLIVAGPVGAVDRGRDRRRFWQTVLGSAPRLHDACWTDDHFHRHRGWLWLLAAFLGSVLGTYLRPWFGLSVEGNLTRAQRLGRQPLGRI